MSNTFSMDVVSQGNNFECDSVHAYSIPDDLRYPPFSRKNLFWPLAPVKRGFLDENFELKPGFGPPHIADWLTTTDDHLMSLKEAIRQSLVIQDSLDETRLILGIRIPRPLWNVVDTVESSTWMLELEEDWDGDGSVAYSKVTWERAVRFLATNAISLWEECQIAVDAPAVHNGPNGSIDIYWKTPTVHLLINVPPENHGDASFYGKNIEGKEIKGTLSLESSNHWLFLWQTGKQRK